jgi:xanthine dehydrogenase accessory factor
MTPELMKTSLQLLDAGTTHVQITVVDTKGSAPQKEGASMLVTADAIHGTVGGGAFEFHLQNLAREMIAKGPDSAFTELNLKDLKMACGGLMSAHLQVLRPSPSAHIFGAGHCARALTPVLLAIGFRVRVSDHRPEWADPAAFPAGTDVVCEEIPTTGVGAIKPNDWVLVMTHDHRFDFEAACLGLRASPAYLGVMASRSKAAAFRKRLMDAGFTEAQAQSVVMPVGLDLGALGPAEIAVSIASQLVALRRGKS